MPSTPEGDPERPGEPARRVLDEPGLERFADALGAERLGRRRGLDEQAPTLCEHLVMRGRRAVESTV